MNVRTDVLDFDARDAAPPRARADLPRPAKSYHAMSSAACDLGDWLAATDNNTSPRRVIVVDAWPHVGIGHSLRASSLYLRLFSALSSTRPETARSLRFASCVPARLRAAFNEEQHEVPSCSRRVFDPIAKRNVSAVSFDVHHYLTIAGLQLRASRSDFADFQRGWRPPKVRTCLELKRMYRSASPDVLVVYGLRVRELLETCVLHAGPRAQPPFAGSAGAHACLRGAHLTPHAARPIPVCDVGLHLRSMQLDHRACDVLSQPVVGIGSDRSSPPPPPPPQAGAAGEEPCRFLWRAQSGGRRCPTQTLAQVVAGCPGTQRFATADAPRLYAQLTRPRGWRDLDEAASVSWNERATTPYPAQLGDVGATAAAFVSLARCTRAIVAPVASHFSGTAALAAGVPLVGCCSEVPTG